MEQTTLFITQGLAQYQQNKCNKSRINRNFVEYAVHMCWGRKVVLKAVKSVHQDEYQKIDTTYSEGKALKSNILGILHEELDYKGNIG